MIASCRRLGFSIGSVRRVYSSIVPSSWPAVVGRRAFDGSDTGEIDSPSAAVVRSPAGDVIDLGVLHAAIQSDPQKQYDLYQSAMTLWR